METQCSWTIFTEMHKSFVDCDLDLSNSIRATYGVIPVCGTHLKWRAVG